MFEKFWYFLIQNLLVLRKNILIEKYAENIEFCWSKEKNLQNC